MTDIVEYPEWVMLRDTMLHDDMGGLGQRIYTSAGSGYTKQKYIRADVVESLRQQLKVQQDAANHWFIEANNDHNRCVKLEQQLAECQERERGLVDKANGYVIENARLTEQLAECQAQNAKLSERVVDVGEIAINSVSRDRLDTLKRQWQREALLEAAEQMESYCGPTVYYELHRMAKELE